MTGRPIRAKGADPRIIKKNSKFNAERVHDVTSYTDFITNVDGKFFRSCEVGFKEKKEE